MNTNIISKILQEDRQWFDVKENLPPVNQEVVIRMCDPTMIIDKTPEGIVIVESIKIGIYLGDKWVVAPPHPKFDYSPLSSGPNLNEGTIVTHWALPEEGTEDDIGELEAWKTRFSLSGKYEKFHVEVDQKHEQLLYRACSLGAACIRQIYGNNPETLPMVAMLWDIQALMDQDIMIRNGEFTKISKESITGCEE